MRPAVFFISLFLLLITGIKPVQPGNHSSGIAKANSFSIEKNAWNRHLGDNDDDISVLSDDLEDDDEITLSSTRKFEFLTALLFTSLPDGNPALPAEYNKPLARFSGNISPVYIFQRVLRI